MGDNEVLVNLALMDTSRSLILAPSSVRRTGLSYSNRSAKSPSRLLVFTSLPLVPLLFTFGNAVANCASISFEMTLLSYLLNWLRPTPYYFDSFHCQRTIYHGRAYPHALRACYKEACSPTIMSHSFQHALACAWCRPVVLIFTHFILEEGRRGKKKRP